MLSVTAEQWVQIIHSTPQQILSAYCVPGPDPVAKVTVLSQREKTIINWHDKCITY